MPKLSAPDAILAELQPYLYKLESLDGPLAIELIRGIHAIRDAHVVGAREQGIREVLNILVGDLATYLGFLPSHPEISAEDVILDILRRCDSIMSPASRLEGGV